MKNWIDIGSDVNWSDYGGKWARRAPDGSWYVVDFCNMVDACGEAEAGETPFVCEVKRVFFADIDQDTFASALECVGCDDVPDEVLLVEALVGYGSAQPLESFSGKSYPERIRAKARRYAERCMRDAALLSERLARPVNAIGSTAEEYGRGDITAALFRGPFDAEKNLIRKLYGFPKEQS